MATRFNNNLSRYHKTAANLAHIGIWEYNVKQNHLLWDDVMFDIYGVDPENFNQSYSDWVSLIHPEDVNVTEKKLQDCIASQDDLDIKFRIIRPDKSLRYIQAKGKFETQEDGSTLLIGINWDETKEVQSEQELRRSERRNQIFINQSPSAIAMFDTGMKYIAASEQWFIDYGLQGTDIIGKSHYDIFPDISEEWRKIHQECLRGAINKNEDARFKRQDGTDYWLRWHVRPWLRHDDEIGGLIMLTENITERKEVLKQLKISEEHFRGAFESAANGVAVVGLDGSWIEVNNKLSEILGYTSEELKKLTFQDITHEEDLEKDLTLLQELINMKRSSYQMEKRYYHKNGNIVWIVLAVAMVTDNNGDPLHFISQITDISDTKKAEAELIRYNKILESKNKDLEQYTYIASHDLKEPLNTVKSFIDLIEMDYGHITGNFSQYFGFIKQSIERLSNLIYLLLDHSKLSQNVDFVQVDLNKVLKDALSDLSQPIKKKKAIVDVKKLPTVIGSEDQLRVLFQNLISNALKFQKESSVPEITIGVTNRNDISTIYVKDNGIGIGENHHQKVFEIFQRINNRDEYPGSGIGLANCKKIIDLHHGEIFVESEPGKGSTFWFTLSEQQ